MDKKYATGLNKAPQAAHIVDALKSEEISALQPAEDTPATVESAAPEATEPAVEVVATPAPAKDVANDTDGETVEDTLHGEAKAIIKFASAHATLTEYPVLGPQATSVRLKANSAALAIVQAAYAARVGWSRARERGSVFLADELAPIVDAIRAQQDENIDHAPHRIPETILGYLSALNDIRVARIKENLDKGLVEFSDLASYYEEGAEVSFSDGDDSAGGVVKSTDTLNSWTGTEFVIGVTIIAVNPSQGVNVGVVRLKIAHYEGLREIKSLRVQKITSELKAALHERGKLFAAITSENSYVNYQGQLEQPSWWSSKIFNANGRIMVDAKTIGIAAPGIADDCRRGLRVSFDDDDRDDVGHFELKEDRYWMTAPSVVGFSFTAKAWGVLRVSGISDIAWREDAWDKLVLEPERKEIVQALVEYHGEGFSDIVDDKGGGVIFMLSGPPGEGKTLTMETIAEYLKRPLYRVSVGELGTDPDQLEERLRGILDIATIWNAVVGLDEADIFLAKREKNDILRNAMVGVFLRLTEYHQGVLFLTTNLMDSIDPAFESRISVHITFQASDVDKRTTIWNNLLSAAKVPQGTLDVNELAKKQLNGRQIKNIIRQTQTLAKARGVPISMDVAADVIAVSSAK